MKILNAAQIRDWDQYTMQHEPITSIDLMERAALCLFHWLENNGWLSNNFTIFCGKGNNGGDGLALARLLSERGISASVHILEFGFKGTDDFQINLARLHHYPAVETHFIQDESTFPVLTKDTVIIDALFGSGLTRPLDGITEKLVKHINESGCKIISIDIPSGLAVGQSSKDNTIIQAAHTLSFQCFKPAFLMAENADFIGDVHILDIGLHAGFLKEIQTDLELTDLNIIRSIYKHRNRFKHKGNFGHALLIAGSYGKIGASVLSAKACLRSGTGLLTCHIPKCGYDILQISVPEAMVSTDSNSSFVTKIDSEIASFDAIGIGPGLGTANETRRMLIDLLKKTKKPLVLDADALNGLSMEKKLPALPAGSILTPHPKEFERLFGKTKNEYERNTKAMLNARLMDCVIVLKGHHTFIATPGGDGYINNTGNAGMATAGSGDVLTGILTGLLAQGYSSAHAAILGVFLHGLAGDIATDKYAQEAMISGDISEMLGEAFKKITVL